MLTLDDARRRAQYSMDTSSVRRLRGGTPYELDFGVCAHSSKDQNGVQSLDRPPFSADEIRGGAGSSRNSNPDQSRDPMGNVPSVLQRRCCVFDVDAPLPRVQICITSHVLLGSGGVST